MRVFHCDCCQHLVFFENVQCIHCKSALAFTPEELDIQALAQTADSLWTSTSRTDDLRQYRLCGNYAQENVCNWAIPSDDPNPLCISCRLTRVIPDLSQQGNKEAWYRLEIAKRRLVYSLLYLSLPVVNRVEDPESGLAFDFLADGAVSQNSGTVSGAVLTGHDQGIITINVAEADDAEREKRRLQMHEPYRTLLGHFRHESGHYYWDRLIRDTPQLESFRALYGDDRADYAQAVKNHYDRGAPPDWQQRFVSAYASTHPWEDWAETWAHYLHMVDTLEMAADCGLSLRPDRKDEPVLKGRSKMRPGLTVSFDKMIDSWFSLTYVLNNLNRGLGLPDGYPFVLSGPAIDKLRFVHDLIEQQRGMP